MKRFAGFVIAAAAACAINFASAQPAQAAAALTGTGKIVREGAPNLVEEARWRGRRVVVYRYYGGPRFHRRVYVHRYRPYRPIYVRPYYVRPYYVRPYYARPVYYGPRCFWRPARTVWTPYGWRYRPPVRICRW